MPHIVHVVQTPLALHVVQGARGRAASNKTVGMSGVLRGALREAQAALCERLERFDRFELVERFLLVGLVRLRTDNT